MAFKFVKSLSGENFPVMRSAPTTANTAIPADAAVSLASGKTAIATGTAKPAFISAGAVLSSAVPADTPAQIVLSHHVWETTFAVDPTAISEGDKVTIHTDGLQVTATTTGGVASVVRKFGSASGSKVWVRFE
jgi:3D (Asp-Asp-Asp) domain-containing protein